MSKLKQWTPMMHKLHGRKLVHQRKWRLLAIVSICSLLSLVNRPNYAILTVSRRVVLHNLHSEIAMKKSRQSPVFLATWLESLYIWLLGFPFPSVFMSGCQKVERKNLIKESEYQENYRRLPKGEVLLVKAKPRSRGAGAELDF